MKKTLNGSFLTTITQNMTRNRNVFGTLLCVESGDKSISWLGAAGELNKDDRFYIASVTKLCITTLILMLRNEGRLKLDDKIVSYFPEKHLDGLHVSKGVDYTDQITITHLLSNTSGIPDYFSHKQPNGKTGSIQTL